VTNAEGPISRGEECSPPRAKVEVFPARALRGRRERSENAADLRSQLRPAKNFAAIMPRRGRNEDYAIRQLSRVTCRRLMHTCMKRLSAGRVIISIMISIINAGGGWFTALSSIINADLSPPRDNATLVTQAAASAERQRRCCRSPSSFFQSFHAIPPRIIPVAILSRAFTTACGMEPEASIEFPLTNHSRPAFARRGKKRGRIGCDWD
jgi:hypothetical protein